MSTVLAAPHQVEDFISGMFRWLLREEAFRMCTEDQSGPANEDERWRQNRTAYYTAALEVILDAFPEPLRSELRSKQSAIITDLVGLN